MFTPTPRKPSEPYRPASVPAPPDPPAMGNRQRLFPFDHRLLTSLASAISIASFLYFFSEGMTNHYGDGIAHVNIARKVVDSPDDSLWQRYIQIGTPWLPLQTVLMLPLVSNDWMWRNGVAGSLISMISFVVAALAIYSLASRFYSRDIDSEPKRFALLSVGLWLLNPSVLFMQSTPMTEILSAASLLVALALLQRWVEVQTSGWLILAGVAMSVATLSRYEAWPVAALTIPVIALAVRGGGRARLRDAALFSTVVAAGPAYWLWHNWAIYGNGLEFLTGPHSARGIALQNRASLGWSQLFIGNATLDVATILAAAAVCGGPLVVMLAFGGLARALLARRRFLIDSTPALLLLVPFCFHVVSLYRGEIQVFPLSAFGLHNVRYGLLHLPAIALFAPACVLIFRGHARRRAFVVVCLVAVLQYALLVSEGWTQLAVYQEGYRNGVNSKSARELSQASAFLKSSPPERLILMTSGTLGPLVSKGGLRFADVIHEGTARWHQIRGAVPPDVFTVVVEVGDPLDQRLKADPALTQDLNRSFREEFSVGAIRLFRRAVAD